MPDDIRRDLPTHVEETVRSLAELHADHHQNATTYERVVLRFTALLARPAVSGLLAVTAVGWMGVNLAALSMGYRAFDPPPFAWLSGLISLVSLYVVLLILAAQRREDQLTQRREQLTLELASLSERKAAKIIQLLEEFRRDNPQVHDRVDAEADEMARPADQESVLVAIRDSHAEAEQTGKKMSRRNRPL